MNTLKIDVKEERVATKAGEKPTTTPVTMETKYLTEEEAKGLPTPIVENLGNNKYQVKLAPKDVGQDWEVVVSKETKFTIAKK